MRTAEKGDLLKGQAFQGRLASLTAMQQQPKLASPTSSWLIKTLAEYGNETIVLSYLQVQYFDLLCAEYCFHVDVDLKPLLLVLASLVDPRRYYIHVTPKKKKTETIRQSTSSTTGTHTTVARLLRVVSNKVPMMNDDGLDLWSVCYVIQVS